MTKEPLKTVGLVRAYMHDINPNSQQLISDEDLGQFNCIYMAKTIRDQFSIKEFADWLAQGIPPMYVLVALQATLNGLFDDLETQLELEIADCQLRIEVADFIGNNVVKQELQDKLKRLIELEESY